MIKGSAMGRGSARLRLLAVAALVLVLAALALLLRGSAPVHAGPFYAIPARLPPGPPGTIIRQEAIPGFYDGAKAYRVLYRSTGWDGRPTAVSGLIVVPDGSPPRGGRRVIAFTHATLGIARDCAPSLRGPSAAQTIEGLGEFLAAGYIVAATDYQGLGTPAPHPFLVGRVEAIDALDSVRAARRLRQAHASSRFAVWGHSQGGQAALFAGQLAASYAPELHLVGVAAGAPMPQLASLLHADARQPVARALVGLALASWSAVYPRAPLARVVAPAALAAVTQLAGQCLYGRALGSSALAGSLDARFLRRAPWRVRPWRSIAEANSPAGTPTPVPVLITQGTADPIVPARLTERLVRRLCAEGDTVELRLYPSVGHVEAGVLVAPDVAGWIASRFDGDPAPSTCGTLPAMPSPAAPRPAVRARPPGAHRAEAPRR